MSRAHGWRIAYVVLFAGFLVTAALNMLHVHGGFFTNHAADLIVPAWLYLVIRGLHGPSAKRAYASTVGRTPEMAALILFVASTATEVSQYFWPHGPFRGTFDPLDIVAYAAGLGACYLAEKRWPVLPRA